MSVKDYSAHAQQSRQQTTDKPIRGQEDRMVQNDSGHYVYGLSDLAFFERFLILGAIGGAFHCGAQTHFDRAMDMLIKVRDGKDAMTALNILVDVSVSGRAPKNDPAIFALAVFTGATHFGVKAEAYKALPKVCRTATHLFTFMEFIKATGRGYGRGLKKAVGRWYTEKDFDNLVYQMIKYRNRSGWTHRDVLRKVRPKTADPKLNALFRWVCYNPQRTEPEYHAQYQQARATVYALSEQAAAFIDLQETPDDGVNYMPLAIKSINEKNMPWETLATSALANSDVWGALAHKAPMGALIRNLGRMSSLGLTEQGATLSVILNRFSKDAIQGARIHPMNILTAMKTYAQGHGMRGKSAWKVSQQIVDAMDDAFYHAFKNVDVTGKRYYLGIDVSASMTWNKISGGGITPLEAAAAMALITLDTEPGSIVKGFSGNYHNQRLAQRDNKSIGARAYVADMPLSTRRRLDDNVKTALAMGAGATILEAPIRDAIENNLEVDVFVIYTDNETNTRFGGHPMIALDEYRRKTGIDAKMIVVGMEGNPFTIADPTKPYTMDVVGFDSSCPSVIANYARMSTKIQ